LRLENGGYGIGGGQLRGARANRWVWPNRFSAQTAILSAQTTRGATGGGFTLIMACYDCKNG